MRVTYKSLDDERVLHVENEPPPPHDTEFCEECGGCIHCKINPCCKWVKYEEDW